MAWFERPARWLARTARLWPQMGLLVALAFLLAMTANAALRENADGRIRIVAGQVPPQMNRSGEGREAQIIQAALAKAYGAQRVEFHVLPFSRHWSAFEVQSSDGTDKDELFDAVATVPAGLDLGGFPSAEYIAYRNGIIYRRADFPDGLGADPIARLRGQRVVAFAGAAGILRELRDALPQFRSYAEYDDQYAHSVLLARGAVDVVIADGTIIDHYNQTVRRQDYPAYSSSLMFDPVFCPTPYHLVFRTDEMRNAFDQGLALIQESGELPEINRTSNAHIGLQQVARPQSECR